MAFNIGLTAGDRNTLFIMNQGLESISTSQTALNTGNSVNGPTDDPLKYFQATGLSNNADDFLKLKDGIGQSIKTVQAAIGGLQSIETLINSLDGLISQARGSNDTTTLTNLSNSFNSIVGQIDNLAHDTSYNGKNLIENTSTGGTYDMSVLFGIDSNNLSTLTVSSIGVNTASIGLSTAANAWAASTDIDASKTAVDAARVAVRAAIQQFSTNMTILDTRNKWTDSHVKTLQDGTSLLVQADKNQLAAQLKSLQTSQIMGVTNLGFSNQLQQAVLGLLR